MNVNITRSNPTTRTLRNRRKRQRRAARLRQQRQGNLAPQAQPTRPRQGRSARNNRSGAARGRGNRNPYLRCILYPETARGCKVPDIISTPSATSQNQHRRAVTVGAGGFCGMAYVPDLVYDVGTCVEAGGALAWTLAQSAGAASAQANFSKFRIVSVSLTAESYNSSQTDQGYIVAVPIIRNIDTPTNTWDIDDAFGAQFYPLKKGARITWRPTDNKDMEYLTSTTGHTSVTAVTGAHLRTTSYGGIALYVLGAEAGSTIRFRVFANYEGIPVNSAFGTQNVEPSPVQPSQLASAMAVLQNIPYSGALYVGAAGAAYLYEMQSAQDPGVPFNIPDLVPDV